MIDLLVVGAGLSGLTAALVGAEAGLKVKLVGKGMGALHWHSGGIDLWGYDDQNQLVERPFEAWDQLPKNHPYHALGLAGVQESFASMERWLAPLGYGARADGRSWLLPTAVGAFRPTWLAPKAQQAGDMREKRGSLIVGFTGMRDFYPDLVAENLNKQGVEARATSLPLSMLSEKRDRTGVQLAKELEGGTVLEHLVARLRQIAQPGERIGLPAILGLKKHTAVWEHLSLGLDNPIFEIPLLPPSVPGMRVHQLLIERFKALGGRVEIGVEMVGCLVDGKKVAKFVSEAAGKRRYHQAKRYLLATGGILGGGIVMESNGRLVEQIVHLPIEANVTTNGRFLQPQALFGSGIRVNEKQQPIDEKGAVLFENLYGVGHLIGGIDTISVRSFEGVAIGAIDRLRGIL